MENKKNVIYIVVDALSLNSLEKYPWKEELFLYNFIKKDSLFFTNCYSDGAFTEASMKSLFCGERCVENGGFFYSTRNCKTDIFTDYSRRGYETLYLTADMMPFTDELYNRSLHVFNSSPFNMMVYLKYRFDYLSKNKEYGLLREVLMNAYNQYILFYKLLAEEKEDVSLFLNRTFVPDTIEDYVSNLVAEKESLKPESFHLEKSLLFHPPLPCFDFSNDFITRNQKQLEYIDRKARKSYHSHLNVPTNRFELIKSLFKKETDISFRAKISRLVDWNERLKRFLTKKDDYYDIFRFTRFYTKKIFSFRTIVDRASLYINNFTSPFLCVMQPQDYHMGSCSWTYDLENQELFDHEMSEINRIIDSLPKKYPCDVYSLLSIRYVDNQIKKLFETIDKDVLSNSIVVITSDHGDWTKGIAKRKLTKDVFYDERHHTPLFIWQKGNGEKTIESFINQSEVLSIVKNLSIGNKYVDKHKNYLIESNLGGGCPDINKRPILFNYHDSEYSISLSSPLNTKIGISSIKAIFNLKKDPYQLKSLSAKKIDKVLLTRIISLVEEERKRLLYSNQR